MFEKLALAFNVFRQGSALADPELWRDRQAATNTLTATLAGGVALAGALGHPLPVPDTVLSAVATVVVVLVGAANSLLHVASTPSAGLPARRQIADSTPVDTATVVVPPSARPGPPSDLHLD